MATINDTELIEAALQSMRRGWQPLYVPLRSKNPGQHNWGAHRLTEDQIPRVFARGGNLSLLTGEPSSGLTDVDLDAPEALACAEEYLPVTRMVHGRPGKPDSHRWYTASPPPRVTQWRDTDGTMLLELRGTGGHTLIPPSVHPNGEILTWTNQDEPARVDLDTLNVACRRLAATALLARHWPATGSRHEAALAAGGFLIRGGLSGTLAATLVQTAARVAGDEEWQSRNRDVLDTARNLTEGRSVTGLPTLVDLLTEGDRVATKLRDWLGLMRNSAATHTGNSLCPSPKRWDPPFHLIHSLSPWPIT